jgi:hypothetical protein
MFLDDELFEIGSIAINPLFNASSFVIANAIIKVILQDMIKDMENQTDLRSMRANMRRVNNQWKLAVKRLEKEGCHEFRSDGFERFIQNNNDFKQFASLL